MDRKVEAASAFVLAIGRRANICSLDSIDEMVAGKAGTEVSVDGPDD